MQKQYFVYIITSFEESVLYTGVTNDLIRRIYEHKNKLIKGFSSKYNLQKLVYYEIFDYIEDAILREKQIKAGSRKKKIDLINSFNESWQDLYDGL
ncbi:MAG: excinuclease ABC subunit C [Candidatus Melainabacteria bacterium GWF2_32_7]|nr:MAG: excinuclease ABC subunit C [Candidatus Melainabacteria bacterium GWF2_32_7]